MESLVTQFTRKIVCINQFYNSIEMSTWRARAVKWIAFIMKMINWIFVCDRLMSSSTQTAPQSLLPASNVRACICRLNAMQIRSTICIIKSNDSCGGAGGASECRMQVACKKRASGDVWLAQRIELWTSMTIDCNRQLQFHVLLRAAVMRQ